MNFILVSAVAMFFMIFVYLANLYFVEIVLYVQIVGAPKSEKRRNILFVLNVELQ